MDGMLRIAALGVITHLLPGLLLASYLGAVLYGQVVAVAAGHVVTQWLPAHCHLFGLDFVFINTPTFCFLLIYFEVKYFLCQIKMYIKMGGWECP